MLCIVSVLGLRAAQVPTNGGVYYLYNTGNGKFLTRGNTYGTQAVTNDFGQPWQVTINEGAYQLRMYDLVKAGSSKGLGSNGYSDNGSPIAFTPSGDASGYKLVNGSNYLCSPDTYGNNVLYTDADYNTTWQFLNVDEYKTVLAAKTATQENAIAVAASVDISSSTLAAVVGNTDNWISKDVSSNIPFPSNSSWTQTGVPNRAGNANEGTYGVERYQGGGTYSCTVTGLTKGIYKVGVKAMYRSASNAACLAVGNEGYVNSSAYFSANGNLVQVKDWYSSHTGDAAPNSTGAFVEIANNGGYYTEVYTYVDEDGILELKAVSESYWDSSWFLFNGCTLTYYTDQVSDEDITALVATIPTEGTVPATVYSNLTSLKNTLESAKTIAAYNNLSNAVSVANALVDPYAALLAEIAKAKALGIDGAKADAYADVTTAAEATTNTQALMVDEYNYVATTYQYAVNLGAWNASDNAGTMSSQHWDGTAESTYLEQGAGNKAYNLNSWTVTYDQNLNLPAGNYVFKVAGRTASDHVTINLNVTNISDSNTLLGTVNDFPKGDVGLGINKAGATSFDPADAAGFANNGNGRGWQWRYVKFTLAEAATVKVAVVATADAQYRWMGFCNATVQTDNEANVSLIAYNVALNNAQTVLADATYKNVAGTDKSNLQAAIAADASLDKTDADAIDAATTALNTAASTFTAGVASWNSLVSARAAASGELPYASATKKTALDNAVAAEATDAADAATKAAAIEQANRQYVESNALAEGVVDATNVTNLITNPNADENADGWSGGFARLESEQYTQGDGTLCGGYFDKNGASSYTAEQTIETLGTGKYLLTVTARAQSISGSYQVKATNSKGEAATASIQTIGNQGGVFGRGFNDASVEFLQTAEGNATIGITATNDANFWLSFDRFRLVKLRDLTPEEAFVAATAEDYAALNAAITAAEAKTLGFDEGDYAPYNNVAALTTLAAAKAIDQAAENAQGDVQAATTALTSATWTENAEEVNAVYDGTFAAATNNGAPAGWTMSNNTLGGDYHSRAFVGDDRMSEFNGTNSGFFLRFDHTNANRGSMYYYGNTENYTMPLKEGVTYYAKVDFAGWGSTGKPLRMNVTGPTGFTAVNQQFNTSVRADNANNTPQQFFIVFTANVAGNYVINFQTPGSDDNEHNVVISNVEVMRAASANMTIAAGNKYGTFVAPFEVTIPDGVTAQKVTGVTGSTLEFEDVQTTYIPANTPVVVSSEKAIDETFYGKSVDGTAVAGLLTGVLTTGTTVPAGSYVLQTQNGVQAFYKLESDATANTANRAYLTIPTSSPVNAFFFNDEDADGINAVEATAEDGRAIYNLAGQRVKKAQKGLYIIGGKTVLVK